MSATRHDLPNFRDFCEAACIKLWGEPDSRNARELRWNGADAYSAKTFNRQKKAWYDHGERRGGSTLDLVAYEKGQPKHELRDAAFFETWRKAHEMGVVPGELPAQPNGKGNGQDGPILSTYPYHDENGQLLFEVVRFDTQDPDGRFRQRRPDSAGGWIWDTKGVRTHVLFRLPQLIEALKAGHRVLICEGERDVNTAVALGFVATTMPGGVGKWRSEYDHYFQDADVVVAADNDPQAKDPKTGQPQCHPDGAPVMPGQEHAAAVAKHMRKVVAHVRVINFPQKDLTAWREAGGTKAAIEALIEVAPDLIKAPPDPTPDDDAGVRDEKPTIEIRAGEIGRLVDQVEAALTLRLYRSIATLDAKAPLPSLADQDPTWAAGLCGAIWALNRSVDTRIDTATESAKATSMATLTTLIIDSIDGRQSELRSRRLSPPAAAVRAPPPKDWTPMDKASPFYSRVPVVSWGKTILS
jgi:hypothetical protein